MFGFQPFTIEPLPAGRQMLTELAMQTDKASCWPQP